MASDYYNILEVPHTASAETIKKAYYRLALRDHPDKNNGTENATERFKAISIAWGVLRDANRRRLYDATYTPPSNNPAAYPRRPWTETTETAKTQKSEKKRKKQEWANWLRSNETTLWEADKKVRELKWDILMLDLQDQGARENLEAAQKSWWTMILSLSGQKGITEEEKTQRECERLQRNAARTIYEERLKSAEETLRVLREERAMRLDEMTYWRRQEQLRRDAAERTEAKKPEDQRKNAQDEMRRQQQEAAEKLARVKREARLEFLRKEKEDAEKPAKEPREIREAWERKTRRQKDKKLTEASEYLEGMWGKDPQAKEKKENEAAKEVKSKRTTQNRPSHASDFRLHWSAEPCQPSSES